MPRPSPVPVVLLLAAATACDPGALTVEDPPSAAGPTWHGDVAPIVAEHCAGCHQAGQIAAELPLQTAEQATPWAGRIAEVVAEGSMPPWGAETTDDCPTPWDFLDDPRPSAVERDTLVAWAEAGAPLGTPAPAPAPVSPEPMADANQYLAPLEPYEVPGDVEDVTICFSLDPALDAPGWLEGVQVVPDNEGLVHHAGVRLDASGDSADLVGPEGWYVCDDVAGVGFDAQYLGTFAPGSGPSLAPRGAAMPVPAGARLVLSVHYHPTGDQTVPDQTGLDLRWADGPPERIALLNHWPDPPDSPLRDLIVPGPHDPDGEPELFIPAGASDHTEILEVPVPGDPSLELELWQIAAHMHVVGASARVTAVHADGSETCLLHVPRWDFDWQRIYRYDPDGAHPSIRGGDTLRLACTYDNSATNDQLVDSWEERGLDGPEDVAHGTGTWDEMCMFMVGTLL